MHLRDKNIDYELLADACKYYSKIGFIQVEVPWIVEPHYSTMTLAPGDTDNAYVLNDGNRLVCSGEQGLIRHAAFGRLKPNTDYFSVTPCFRKDDVNIKNSVATHSNWFIKLELFRFACDPFIYSRFAWQARTFFSEVGVETIIMETPFGCDLTHKGLELGSYGSRILPTINMNMVYGTGLALPRFSLAKPG